MHERLKDKWRYEGILIVRFFSKNKNATMKDARKEFCLSKDTLRKRIKYIRGLHNAGYFSNNPEFEKELGNDIEMAINHISSNRGGHKKSKITYDQKYIRICLQKALVKC